MQGTTSDLLAEEQQKTLQLNETMMSKESFVIYYSSLSLSCYLFLNLQIIITKKL